MKIIRLAGLCLTLTLVAAQPTGAQDRGGLPAQGAVPAAATQTVSPYTGMQIRAVKALSEQQIADLRAGRGMSMALPAELNGYPGPIHVLEHADALQLSSDQKRRTQAMYEAMKAETIPLGERLIAQETKLDRAFATRTITAKTLAETSAAIGKTQAALRAAFALSPRPDALADAGSATQLRRITRLHGGRASSRCALSASSLSLGHGGSVPRTNARAQLALDLIPA
jgi:hypothetical protein